MILNCVLNTKYFKILFEKNIQNPKKRVNMDLRKNLPWNSQDFGPGLAFFQKIFSILKGEIRSHFTVFLYTYLYNKNILVEIAGTDGDYWAHSNH